MSGVVYVVTVKKTNLFAEGFRRYYVFADYLAVLDFADKVKEKYKDYDQVQLQSWQLFHGFTRESDEVECFYSVEPLLDSADSIELL